MIDKIALLYIKDGRILSSRSRGKDTWYLPGGKRKGLEGDLETLHREIKEELSVNIIPGSETFRGFFEAQAHGKAEGTTVRMTCYSAELDGIPRPDHEIEELAWFTYADRDKGSPVDKLIFDDLYSKGLII